MPVPVVRNPLRPARGTLAALQTNIADLYESEVVWATDTQSMYVKQGIQLVEVVHSQSHLPLHIVNPEAGESLNYDGSEWANGGPQNGGNF